MERRQPAAEVRCIDGGRSGGKERRWKESEGGREG
jgi:hypothetical protein